LLPWVFSLVQCGLGKKIPNWLRESLASGLYKLSEQPDEHGVFAAKLHRHVAG